MVSFRKSSFSTNASQGLLALVLALFCLGSEAAQASIESQSPVRPTPFPVCIDDSDCLKIGEGNKYACFQVRDLELRTFGSKPSFRPGRLNTLDPISSLGNSSRPLLTHLVLKGCS